MTSSSHAARQASPLRIGAITWVALATLLAACDRAPTAVRSPAHLLTEPTTAYLTGTNALKHRFGDRQGDLDGVPIFWNSANGAPLTEVYTPYGIAYQCVEFVRRYYGEHFREPLPRMNAVDYWSTTQMPRHLRRVSNGGAELPEKGDIIVMTDGLGGYGHIAIVRSATRSQVRIAQQNHEQADYQLTVSTTSRGGTPTFDVGAIRGRRTLGWYSRRSAPPIVLPQIQSVAPAKPRISTRPQRIALATRGIGRQLSVYVIDPTGKKSTFGGAALTVTPGGIVFSPTLNRAGTWSFAVESDGLSTPVFRVSVGK